MLAAVGREPLRPASCARASAQQASRADDYNVRQANLDTPSARPAASHFDLHGMHELQHRYRAGLATTTWGTPTPRRNIVTQTSGHNNPSNVRLQPSGGPKTLTTPSPNLARLAIRNLCPHQPFGPLAGPVRSLDLDRPTHRALETVTGTWRP
jgi:hypothetical protein